MALTASLCAASANAQAAGGAGSGDLLASFVPLIILVAVIAGVVWLIKRFFR